MTRPSFPPPPRRRGQPHPAATTSRYAQLTTGSLISFAFQSKLQQVWSVWQLPPVHCSGRARQLTWQVVTHAAQHCRSPPMYLSTPAGSVRSLAPSSSSFPPFCVHLLAHAGTHTCAHTHPLPHPARLASAVTVRLALVHNSVTEAFLPGFRPRYAALTRSPTVCSRSVLRRLTCSLVSPLFLRSGAQQRAAPSSRLAAAARALRPLPGARGRCSLSCSAAGQPGLSSSLGLPLLLYSAAQPPARSSVHAVPTRSLLAPTRSLLDAWAGASGRRSLSCSAARRPGRSQKGGKRRWGWPAAVPAYVRTAPTAVTAAVTSAPVLNTHVHCPPACCVPCDAARRTCSCSRWRRACRRCWVTRSR
jgi:hypothetical protein